MRNFQQPLNYKFETQTKQSLLILLVIIIGIYFRFVGLGSTIFNDDAHMWYDRTTEFMTAVTEVRLGDTYIDPKPGVTLMWLSGISYKSYLAIYDKVFGFRPELYEANTFPLVHFATKAPLVIVSVLFFIAFYFLVSKLIDKKTALFATLLLAVEPFYIGVSRWMHLDGLLSAFMPLSALLLILSLSLDETWNYEWKKIRLSVHRLFVLSAVAAALALLSKTQAVFLLLYLPLVLLIDLSLPFSSIIDRMKSREVVTKYCKKALIWYALTAVVFLLLFPAMWVHPIGVVEKMLNEGLFIANTGRNDLWGKYYQYYALPLRLSPITLLFSTFGIFWILVKIRQFDPVRLKTWISLFGYLFFYFLMISMVRQKIDRYLLPLFPIIIIFGGYGAAQLVGKIASEKLRTFTSLAFILVAAFYTITYSPNYSTYFNPLLGGRTTAESRLLLETKGELGGETARYLNNQENAEDMTAVVTYAPLSIRPFFKGQTFDKNENIPQGVTVDYVVSTWKQEIPEYYSSCSLEHTIIFKHNPYWFIYNCGGMSPPPADD